MQEWIITTGMLAGGLGLFLLAVGMITDGLRLAGGHALRDLLGKWTSSPGRGIASGFAITAMVQSSSAVTIATIGFVNAGLITLQHALWVVYGSNIGTTVTAWLVALVGVKLQVQAFALPMVGIGMLLRLSGGESRRAPLGLALAGFGLFFIGIDVLREAFQGLASNVELQEMAPAGIAGVLLYVGIGFIMTLLTQSSIAAITITLTASAGGIVGLHAAAALVIGANIGTTSTAALAVLGATPNAKRVAAAHLLFNILTGAVALLILPLLFWMVDATSRLLGLADMPTLTLALFHTVFNILGVLLMWPLTGHLIRFLERRFVTLEEVEGRPRYLDKTVAVSPLLALHALGLELSRIAGVVRRMALAVLSTDSVPGRRIASDHMIVAKLSQTVADFINRLGRDAIGAAEAEQLAALLRAEQHLLACAEQALEIGREQAALYEVQDATLAGEIARYRSAVVALMEQANPEAEQFSLTACEAQLEQVQLDYEAVKAQLLHAGAQLRIPITGMIGILDQNSRMRRMARQMLKAMRYLVGMRADAQAQSGRDDGAIPLQEGEL